MKSLLLVLIFISSCLAGDVEISRVYKSSKQYLKVVIKTSKELELKCAALDEKGNPISVTTQYVTPPFAEVLIRVPESLIDQVKNVDCYKK